jgi:hypothetical protein
MLAFSKSGVDDVMKSGLAEPPAEFLLIVKPLMAPLSKIDVDKSARFLASVAVRRQTCTFII